MKFSVPASTIVIPCVADKRRLGLTPCFMVLPKGTSFEFLTQWDVNLIVNHINSTPRESLNGSTPYDAALETLGKETLNAFQLKRIDPDLVNLTPKLIRFNH